jgi:TolA-binding protein
VKRFQMSSRVLVGPALAAALACTPASAQRQQGLPEQRIDRLEKQVEQVQRAVFPKGRPADTAGLASEPAATQSAVTTLAQRLDSLEKQMSDLVRLTEENGNRLRQIERGLEGRSDLEQRIADLERKLAAAGELPVTVADAVPTDPAKPVANPPKSKPAGTPKPSEVSETPANPGEMDAVEAAYTEGFKLWQAGRYDDAIASLRAFTSAYPNHRRTSFANNLIGRAMLDKGDAQSAVQAFLANYQGNPGGERAPDSLYYLGQALTKLGRARQACNAYAELEKIYGDKAEAGCSS